MLIYPAIDLRHGEVVRLHQGDYDQQTRYPLDPLKLAQDYAAAGARWLHVVDLDGARQAALAQTSWVRRMATIDGLEVQSGGGVRSRSDFDRLRDAGVRRVVVGSLFVREPETIGRWLHQDGPEALCIALDVRADGAGWQVQVSGWRESGHWTLEAAMESAVALGARHFLVTDIGRDGTLAGPSLLLYRALVTRFPNARIQASGGVSCLADLDALRDTGVAGVIVGKALLEGCFSLSQALDQGGAPC